MAAILTPPLALRHLRQLSTDVRAAVVVSAGDLAVLAREPAGRGEGPAAPAAASPTGTILAVGDDEHLLAVVAGPQALLPLLEHDLVTLLADMRAGGPAE